MKLSREKAAEILLKITLHQAAPEEREALHMGAEALRKLDELEAWAKVWQDYYWEQWKTVRKKDYITRQDAYAFMRKAINETLPGPPGGTDET